MSNCKKLPYFEGLTDETIKQGSDFDLTEGVTAYDGNDEEIEYSTSPTNAEFDTCDVGSHVIQYHAGQPVDRFLPNICLGTDLAVSIPSYCDNYQGVTKERIIRIIQAANPTIYGIPHVTIAQNTPFDPLNGVSAVDDNGNPITDIEYSGYLDTRVSGNPITITDGQSVIPVKSLEVELDPIQDLHGYDKPWTGGAGKNILPITLSDGTASGLNYTVLKDNGGNVLGINLQGTPTTTVIELEVGSVTLTEGVGYKINGCSYPNSDLRLQLKKRGTSTSLVQVYDGRDAGYAPAETAEYFVTFVVILNGQSVNETIYPMIRLSTNTDDTYVPYTNIAPISGWTDVDTYRTGINVWDEEWEVGGIKTADGTLVPSSAVRAVRSKNFCNIKGGTSYYVKSPTDVYVFFYDATQSYLTYTALHDNTFTSPQNASYFKIQISSTYGTTYNNDISINYPSTDTEYHAYQGTSYTTALGRTVYGGTLDVVSGELVVDSVYAQLDTETTYRAGGQARFDDYWVVSVMDIPNISGNIKSESSVISSTAPKDMVYNRATVSGFCKNIGSPYPIFALMDSDSGLDGSATLAQIQEAMNALIHANPPQLVYELATPQTYQLDPQTIMLLTGDNNLWSDGQMTMVYSTEVPTEGDITYPLEGEYTLTYRVTDKCGNVGEATRQITVVANEVQSVQNVESEVSD